MPSPEWPAIGSGPLEARFLPENGGRMTHLVHERLGDILVPIASRDFEPLNWPKAGAYPLFPYHNRMIGAAFEHDGKLHRLLPHPALAPDAQHGPAHRRPWHVLTQGAGEIRLAIDYEADEDWPFSFRAVQHFMLSGDRLDVGLCVSNTGEVSMPAGFGWHPYFAAGFAQPASSDAAAIWPAGAAGIPCGDPSVPRNAADPLVAESFTIFISEWSEARVRSNGGADVTITTDQQLPHLVAHRMQNYICLEPVSHVAGVFSFPAERRGAAGLFVLQPGEEKSARLSLHIC